MQVAVINLLIFIVATIGLSHIIVDGSIFNSFKEWLSGKKSKYTFVNRLEEKISKYVPLNWCKNKLLELMGCYLCSGWWASLLVSFIMWFCGCDPLQSPFDWTHALLLFVYACAGAFLSMLGAVTLMFL